MDEIAGQGSLKKLLFPCHQKKMKKQTGGAWNLLQPQYKSAEVPHSPISKIFFCPSKIVVSITTVAHHD